MQVAVEYLAQVKHAAGTPAEAVTLEGPCCVQELVRRLAEQHGRPLRDLLLDAAGALQPTILLFVGDQQVVWATPQQLRDGDRVTLVSPMAGG